jgi:hypothetical protein
MPDRERERAVRKGVEQVRQMLADPAYANIEDHGVRPQNLAEAIALLVAQARDDGSDETLLVEVVLRASDSHRDALLEAREVLAALGYIEIAALLKRLAPTAPRRITWRERMRAKAREYAAMRRPHMYG